MKYKTLPVEIEAVQYKEIKDIIDFCEDKCTFDFSLANVAVVGSKENFLMNPVLRVKKGDWIIKDITGKFYCCCSEVFNLSYEGMEDE